jgi:hypothetical protein
MKSALRALPVAAAVLVVTAGGRQAGAQPDPLPATLNAPWTLDGTSGSTANTGNSELVGTVTLTNGFFVEYLVVGGGGGGGTRHGGGGGAGGFLEGRMTVTSTSYNVVSGSGGDGGAAATGTPVRWGYRGGDSSFGSITALGGGGGQSYEGVGNNNTLIDGGSGGGGAGGLSRTGGSGVPGEGFGGGTGGTNASGGGGGGAGAVGGDVTLGNGGNGGIGKVSTITGSSVYYAGGGGGGGDGSGSSGNTGGAGGEGGGGRGGDFGDLTNATAGTDGRGGGGGGNRGLVTASPGMRGGSGIVVVRYAGAQAAPGGAAGTGSAEGYWVNEYASGSQASTSGTFDMSAVDFDQRLGSLITGTLSGAGDLVFAGPGRLTLAGANTYSGTTAVQSGTLALGATGSLASAEISVAVGAAFDVTAKSNFSLGSQQRLGGRGTILGNLEFQADSWLVFDPLGPLVVGSGTISFAPNFGIGNIFGLSGATPEGTYTLFDTNGGITDYANLAFGPNSAVEIGGDKKAYFEQGSLVLVVVPEPGSLCLVGLGLGIAALASRRRRW